MLTLLNSGQIRLADDFTIQKRSGSSLDLMEAASRAFVSVFKAHFNNHDLFISVYCGTGNNGGDGLAIARLLKEEGYDNVSVKLVWLTGRQTSDFISNIDRLGFTGIKITEITEGDNLPDENAEVLIDAILGSGLNRPISESLAKLTDYLNSLKKTVVAVDVPTGFLSEGKLDGNANVLKADLAITFQRPRINFFFPESAQALKQFKVADIGLDENFIQSQPSNWFLVEEKDIRKILRIRENFSHKGSYGHALIVAGSMQTMGAALLCAEACLHAGAGLTTAMIPRPGLTSLNTRSPEIMAIIREDEDPATIEYSRYPMRAIGPGFGTSKQVRELFETILQNSRCPLVIDADGLNLLAQNPAFVSLIPPKSILTPHVKEFDRLFDDHQSWWDRLKTARRKAAELDVIIVLKNRYTFIAVPDGRVFINPTGNPAMATGGTGDVLTGVIAAFLAQGYQLQEAALLGCYLHGKAGDILKTKSGMFCIPPRYIIEVLPETINSLSGK